MQKNQQKSFSEPRYSQINPVRFVRMERETKKGKEITQVMS